MNSNNNNDFSSVTNSSEFISAHSFCNFQLKNNYDLSIRKTEKGRGLFSNVDIPSKTVIFEESTNNCCIAGDEKGSYIATIITKTILGFWNNNEFDFKNFSNFIEYFHQIGFDKNEKDQFDKEMKRISISLAIQNFDYKHIIPNYEEHFRSLYNIYRTNSYNLYCGIGDYSRGYALFPFTSLVNHSCQSNSTTVFSEGKISLITKKTIKTGEEITCEYATGRFLHRIEIYHLRKQLKERFGFDCDCSFCQKHSKFLKSIQIEKENDLLLSEYVKNCNGIGKKEGIKLLKLISNPLDENSNERLLELKNIVSQEHIQIILEKNPLLFISFMASLIDSIVHLGAFGSLSVDLEYATFFDSISKKFLQTLDPFLKNNTLLEKFNVEYHYNLFLVHLDLATFTIHNSFLINTYNLLKQSPEKLLELFEMIVPLSKKFIVIIKKMNNLFGEGSIDSIKYGHVLMLPHLIKFRNWVDFVSEIKTNNSTNIEI
jgi:hypothetical protein